MLLFSVDVVVVRLQLMTKHYSVDDAAVINFLSTMLFVVIAVVGVDDGLVVIVVV